MTPIRVTSQLFNRVKKSPEENRFYIDSDEAKLWMELPSPSDGDLEKWEDIEFKDIPQEVKVKWFSLLDEYTTSVECICTIYSLEVSSCGVWYLTRWKVTEDKTSFLCLGRIVDFDKSSLLDEEKMQPSPLLENQIGTDVIWQGYSMPTLRNVEVLIGAYNIGRSHRTKEVQTFLEK